MKRRGNRVDDGRLARVEGLARRHGFVRQRRVELPSDVHEQLTRVRARGPDEDPIVQYGGAQRFVDRRRRIRARSRFGFERYRRSTVGVEQGWRFVEGIFLDGRGLGCRGCRHSCVRHFRRRRHLGSPEEHQLLGVDRAAVAEEHLRGQNHLAIQKPLRQRGLLASALGRRPGEGHGRRVQTRVLLQTRAHHAKVRHAPPARQVTRQSRGEHSQREGLVTRVSVHLGVAP